MKATMSFKDKLIDYRNRYRKLKGKETKGNFLSRLTDTFGFDRKCLIKLLNGQRDFEPPRGRGRTYGKEVERLALKLRKAAADPCAPYFIEMLPRLVGDWEAVHGALGVKVRDQMLGVSESTVARWFRRHPSRRLRHGNRRSGANRLKDGVPRCPGSAIEDGAPGVVQMDTVAHGGGGPEPFYYSIDITDAATQWTEFDFIWCRGGEAVRKATGPMLKRFPFPVRKAHPDGGGEFINEAVLNLFAKNFPNVEVFKSRPSRPNDNCRVEQKNGSVIRSWLGEVRLDDRSLEAKLHEFARLLCLYQNLFVPCKKLVSKTPKDKLHTKYKYAYDKPMTPLDRCIASGSCDPAAIAKIKALRDKTNVVALVSKIKSLAREIIAAANKTHGCGGASPAAPMAPHSVSSLLTNAVG